jgi:hypothetical protein
MYAVTSPYVRKDGTKQRSYVCASVRDATGLCDAPKIPAEVVDRAVVDQLRHLFIDIESWQREVAQGIETQAAAVERVLVRERKALAKNDGLAEKVQADYLRQLDAGDEQAARFVMGALDKLTAEREQVEQRIADQEAVLAELATEPDTDAMLDLYSRLRDAVQAGQGDDLRELNERLMGIFETFRLGVVKPGVVGVLPVLRPDVVTRYADTTPVAVGPEGEKLVDLPAGSPVALFAEAPPAKALCIDFAAEYAAATGDPTDIGPNTHA